MAGLKNAFELSKEMKYLICLLLCFSYSVSGSLKAADTIVIKLPKYYSSLEKHAFENYLKTKKADISELAQCVDSTQTEEKEVLLNSRINDFIKDMASSISNIKNEKKKIKLIFNAANQKFFKKYSIHANFNDLFLTGDFNCLTGTLFYSIVLQGLNIPFTIKEEQSHVLLLAYPTTFSIPVESTDPGMLTYIPDEKFKRNYVDFLTTSKIITKNDLETHNLESVFNGHYYSSKDINPIELAGLAYYNRGIDAINDKKTKNSFHEFEKAYILYPSDRIRYLLETSLVVLCDELDFTKIDNLDYLLKLISYSKNKNYQDIYLNKFEFITQKYLFQENNVDLYEKIFKKIQSQLEDSALIKSTSNEYYYESARAHAIKGELDQALELIKLDYKMNPDNLNVISLFQQVYADMLQSKNGKDNFMEDLNKSLNEYPCLTKSVEILRVGAVYHLQKAFFYFQHDDITNGSKYLDNFEKFSNKYSVKVETFMIGDVYSMASSCYYRVKDMKNCKAVLERGLKISPNNDELIRKYKVNVTHEIK